MPTEKEIAELEEMYPITPIDAIDISLQVIASLLEHVPPEDYPAWKGEAIEAHSRAMDIIILAQKKLLKHLKETKTKANDTK